MKHFTCSIATVFTCSVALEFKKIQVMIYKKVSVIKTLKMEISSPKECLACKFFSFVCWIVMLGFLK